jgi:YegS/Rv2252/BmrU family lipid kinase
MMDPMSSDTRSAAREHGKEGDSGMDVVKRAAVVVNPTKIDDEASFAEAVERLMQEHGWSNPLWLETTADDPGRGQAQQAVEAGADLVLACGGDGTVTACAEGVAGSNVPLGILPMGTGNLLARNVGLPAHWAEALTVALTGIGQPIDSGIVNGRSFVVMAGVGLDARMLHDTSEPLKRRLGWAAYGVSALRHMRDRPIRVTVAADGGRPRRMRASAVIIGNVGWLRGGLPLMPDARPDDGLLDAVVLNARGLAGWLALAVHVILRRSGSGRLSRIQFSELRLDVDRAQPWELDGEFMGETRQLTVVAVPGRLVLRLPAAREQPSLSAMPSATGVPSPSDVPSATGVPSADGLSSAPSEHPATGEVAIADAQAAK